VKRFIEGVQNPLFYHSEGLAKLSGFCAPYGESRFLRQFESARGNFNIWAMAEGLISRAPLLWSHCLSLIQICHVKKGDRKA